MMSIIEEGPKGDRSVEIFEIISFDLEPDIPDSLFDFDPPEGYTVVDSRVNPPIIVEPNEWSESIKDEITNGRYDNQVLPTIENIQELSIDKRNRIDEKNENDTDSNQIPFVQILLAILFGGGFILALKKIITPKNAE